MYVVYVDFNDGGFMEASFDNARNAKALVLTMLDDPHVFQVGYRTPNYNKK